MRLICLFCIISLFYSCTSHNELLNKHVVGGSCEKTFKKVELSTGQALWENIEEKSGIGASYMVTGLGYSTDLIVIFTGGVLGSIAVCSPFILADGLARANGTIVQGCVNSVSPKLLEGLNPKMGPKASTTTARWKCPQVDSIAEALLVVADCYESKGETKLAEKQVEEILGSSILNECLSTKMKKQIMTFKSSLNSVKP